MSKPHQSGFSLVELLLTVILVSAIGFTGYYVWHSKQLTENTLSQTDKSSSVAVSKKTDPTCSLSSGIKGLLVSVSSSDFRFCEPNGWLLQQYSGNLGSYWAGAGNIIYDAAKTATINTSNGGSDGPFTLTIDVVDRTKVDTVQFSRTGDATQRTSGNLTIDSYTHTTVANDPVGAGIDFLPKDTKQFLEVIYKGGKALVFHYNYQPSETDSSQLVSEVAASTR